ncbi:MAG: YIP1 family protein [Acidobacteriota bacterium]|nr:YIP1 family protein [Acidobacteriota bacterium]
MSDQPETDHEAAPEEFPARPAVPRTGPPWEMPGPAGHRFMETAKAVLLAPTAMFQQMRRDGGVGTPLGFGVVGSTIGFALGVIIQLAITLLTPAENPVTRPLIGVTVFMFLLLLPFILAISLLFTAALYHLMLRILGAARHPFETTLRVVCYVYGSTSLLQIFPVCGGFVGFIYSMFLMVIGLTHAQETTAGKAAVATLVPVLIMTLLALVSLASLISHGGGLPGLPGIGQSV